MTPRACRRIPLGASDGKPWRHVSVIVDTPHAHHRIGRGAVTGALVYCYDQASGRIDGYVFRAFAAMADLMKDAQFRRPDEIFDTEKTPDLGGVSVRGSLSSRRDDSSIGLEVCRLDRITSRSILQQECCIWQTATLEQAGGLSIPKRRLDPVYQDPGNPVDGGLVKQIIRKK